MKAKVKTTGEIIELYRFSVVAEKGSGVPYTLEQLEFEAPFDYWTRLEHQYAGMAMQGMLSNGDWVKLMYRTVSNDEQFCDLLTYRAQELAHILVDKYKKEK